MASLSRPTPHSIFRALVAVAACVAVLALVQRLQVNDSSAATGGLSATFSGKAFTAGADGGRPVMTVRGLRQGDVTSGTVTVRNPGPGTRYAWLSPGRVSERLGSGGGRLTSSMVLTVMDVTDIAAPSVVYRGPLGQLGARPLGFVTAGARRSYSFVAELPTGGRSPAAPAVDPYRGATAAVAWTWHSMPGEPAGSTTAVAAVKPKPRRDRSAPRLSFSTPDRQALLAKSELALIVRCNEDCAPRARAVMRTGGRAWPLATRRAGRGLEHRHALSVRFPGAPAAALREAMLAGHTTRVRVDVEAFDRAGNRRRASHTIALRPQR